ncbi:MAG TPA: hypothetical protein VFC57_00460 [Aeromicrobium sp.]|nr:hypothetical protein [Aeromicrobium sp.]
MNNTDRYTVADNIEHFTIADVAEANPDFRRVLWTGEHAQIVVMTIPVGRQTNLRLCALKGGVLWPTQNSMAGAGSPELRPRSFTG